MTERDRTADVQYVITASLRQREECLMVVERSCQSHENRCSSSAKPESVQMAMQAS